MERVFCKKCGSTSFVFDGETACCGAVVDPRLVILRIRGAFTNIPNGKRVAIKAETKKLVIEGQGNCCAYCLCPLTVGNIHYDHIIPWSHRNSNYIEGIVASCSYCNLKKSNKMFKTIDDVRAFIEESIERDSESPAKSLLFSVHEFEKINMSVVSKNKILWIKDKTTYEITIAPKQ